MDYNFWDDRTHELEINPCKGCLDYQDGKCLSDGGCGSMNEDFPELDKALYSDRKPYADVNIEID